MVINYIPVSGSYAHMYNQQQGRGKFLLVQIFLDLPSRPSELNFAPALDLVLANAHVDIFRGSDFHRCQTICKNCEILHHAKISRYVVHTW